MVIVQIRETGDMEPAAKALSEMGNEYNIERGEQRFSIQFSESGLAMMESRAVEQSIEIIRRRLDPEGTKEPVIQRQGKDRVLVQLPGVDDPEAVKRLLGRTAKLTFQLVDMRMTAAEANERNRTPPGSIVMQSEIGRAHV